MSGSGEVLFLILLPHEQNFVYVFGFKVREQNGGRPDGIRVRV